MDNFDPRGPRDLRKAVRSGFTLEDMDVAISYPLQRTSPFPPVSKILEILDRAHSRLHAAQGGLECRTFIIVIVGRTITDILKYYTSLQLIPIGPRCNSRLRV